MATGGSGIIVTQGGNQIYNNICYGNGRYGIVIFHVRADDPPNEVYNNVLYGNGRAGLAVDGSFRTIVKNNICANNQQHNLVVLSSSGTTLDYNCYWPDSKFLWMPGCRGAAASPAGGRGQPGVGRGKADGDRTSGETGRRGQADATAGGFAEYQKLSGQDAHSVCRDPGFVNAKGHDFHLQADSPCVDAGTAVAVPADIDGKKRPVGVGFDIGAYER